MDIQREVIPVVIPRVTVRSIVRGIRRVWKETFDFQPPCSHRNRFYISTDEQACWDCGRTRKIGSGFLDATWRKRMVR
jgi:hypothetical protein